jgi:hypothetical protein
MESIAQLKGIEARYEMLENTLKRAQTDEKAKAADLNDAVEHIINCAITDGPPASSSKLRRWFGRSPNASASGPVVSGPFGVQQLNKSSELGRYAEEQKAANDAAAAAAPSLTAETEAAEPDHVYESAPEQPSSSREHPTEDDDREGVTPSTGSPYEQPIDPVGTAKGDEAAMGTSVKGRPPPSVPRPRSFVSEESEGSSGPPSPSKVRKKEGEGRGEARQG